MRLEIIKPLSLIGLLLVVQLTVAERSERFDNFELHYSVVNTTFLLTYATIFLVLMSLGIALTKLKVVSWLNASVLSVIRIVIGPVIGFSLIKYLNLTGMAAGVLLIQSAMPSAILTYLVGSMYSEKRVVDSIASVIVTSTLMSFVTIPIVVYLSLKYFQSVSYTHLTLPTNREV